MIGRIETTATRIDVEAIDGYVTLDVMIIDPDDRKVTGIRYLSTLSKVKALQLAQILTAAAKSLEAPQDLPDLGDPGQP